MPQFSRLTSAARTREAAAKTAGKYAAVGFAGFAAASWPLAAAVVLVTVVLVLGTVWVLRDRERTEGMVRLIRAIRR